MDTETDNSDGSGLVGTICVDKEEVRMWYIERVIPGVRTYYYYWGTYLLDAEKDELKEIICPMLRAQKVLQGAVL